MGKSSRDKGKRGEQELAAELRRLGFDSARRSQQYCGTESSADILGLKNIHIECKRCESLSIYKAMQQAICKGPGCSDKKRNSGYVGILSGWKAENIWH